MNVASAVSRVAVVLLLSCAALAGHAQGVPGAPPHGHVADAARLATLAERIAKLQAQVGQAILPERSRKALQGAIVEFDATLRAIAARASTHESRENYALLALLWQDYRDWATRTPTRENARKLRPRTEEVVWIASKGVKLLQREGRIASSPSAERAQGAATLAQRIAKLHLWSRWDIRDDSLARELRDSEESLRRVLDGLRAASPETGVAAGELQAADIQLRFMEDAARALKARDATARSIEFIAKAGDNIQESMERAARLYEGVGP